jgi:hypothetical protein
MPGAIGANAKLYLRPEATYGVLPGGNFIQLAFLTAAIGTRQQLIDARVLGVGTGRDPGDPLLGEIATDGQVEVPINLEGFGHWLRLLMGPPTTSGTAPNLEHEFRSGSATLPSASIVLDYGPQLTERYAVALGVRASTLEVEFSPTGAATARIGLLAQGGGQQAAAVHGTPVTVTGANFNRASGSIARGATPLALVTGASISFSNGVEALRTIRADRKIEEAEIGLAGVTGRVTTRFADGGLLPDAIANTPVDLRLAFEISADRRLELRMPRAFVGIPRGEVQGPGGVSAEYDLQASGDGVTAALVVTLRNAVAGYA